MEQLIVFRLPDVGEGLTEAEILAWRVRPGDHVEVNDVLVDIETAKSVVELPSPAAGVVVSVEAQPGDVLHVGAALVSIRGHDAGSGALPAVAAAPPQASATTAARSMSVSADGQEGEAPLVLVGTGPTAAVARRLRLRPQSERPAPPPRIAPRPPRASVAPGSVAARRLSDDPGGDPGRLVSEWISVDVTGALALIGRAKRERRWAGVPISLLVLAAKVLLDQARRHPDIFGTSNETSRPDHLELDLGLVAGPLDSAAAAQAVPLDGWDLPALAAAIGAADRDAVAQDPGPARSLTVLPLRPGAAAARPAPLTLTLGEIRDQPLVEQGAVLVRQVARLGITIDPSTLDTAVAADLLARVGVLLADPAMAMACARADGVD